MIEVDLTPGSNDRTWFDRLRLGLEPLIDSRPQDVHYALCSIGYEFDLDPDRDDETYLWWASHYFQNRLRGLLREQGGWNPIR